MQTGYPRFFIHNLIEELAQHILEDFGHKSLEGQKAVLFSHGAYALHCMRYLADEADGISSTKICSVSLVSNSPVTSDRAAEIPWEHAEIHAVLYCSSAYPVAKSFWQHSGFGISSRDAKFCLDTVHDRLLQTSQVRSVPDHSHTESSAHECQTSCSSKRHPLQMEESENTKSMLRRRIAGLASSRNNEVTEGDVYLFPSGMSAISTVAQALLPSEDSETPPEVIAYG